MKTLAPLMLSPFDAASPRLRMRRSIFGLVPLLTLLAWQFTGGVSHATGFSDSFEGYARDVLDSTYSGGANEGTPGGANPWFAANPPSLRVVSNEFGIFPHSGTNMVRGKYNGLYADNVSWYNLSYRCATGGVFYGHIALDWWFYDPLGAGGGGDYVDFVGLCNYDGVAPDTDYTSWPSLGSQCLCLGANAARFNTGVDATKYQARILGATDGINDQGWFNLTNTTRSAGWHHARIVIGAPNDVNTSAAFYIDDMKTPALTHATMNNTGFNLLEIDADFGNTSGYFDDFAFQDNAVAPGIATGPANLTVPLGAAAAFSVGGVTGSPAPAFFWQKDGAPLTNGGRISGANSPALTIANTVESDAGSYSCLVSNVAGVAAASATLGLIVPPTLDSQSPVGGNFSVNAGSTVNLSVTAHASNPIRYQWSKDSSPLTNGGHVAGATNAALTITSFDATDVGTYACHLSNSDGGTNSAAVILALAVRPTINVQPTNQIVAAGGTATFTVVAAGSSLAYQWSKGATPLNNGGRVTGATTSALSLSSVIPSDAGTYSCLITNSSGQTNTIAATLTVIERPEITAQPLSQVASNGSTVVFHVVASGTTPAYQWTKNGTALSNGGDFSGVTTADLTIHVSSTADQGVYAVTVTNLAGSRTSSGATLRVNQAAVTFFDDFESYSISDPIGYGRNSGAPLDSNYGDNPAALWWGASPPNFFTYPSGQDGATAFSGNQMIGGAYNYVTSGDNDEGFLNLAYRFNSGQLYYGNLLLDWHFYDPGTADAGDQLALANFSSRMPATSDSSGYQIPASPVQRLFIGTWPNLDTAKYQVGIMGVADGASGNFSKNISGTMKYFDTSVPRSPGWHHARIVLGPADPGTKVANARFFVDDMGTPVFSRDLPAGKVGFNAIHTVACTLFPPATSETAGFFDDVTLQAVNDPFIVQQPVSQVAAYRATATFTVVAMGASFQWQKNGANLSSATTATLTLNSVTSRDEGSYTCVVSGANGSLTSAPATLTVTGSPPFLTATQVGQKVVITWQGAYPLLSATNAAGPYSVVAGAASPYTNNPPLGSQRYFGLGQ